MASFDLYSIYRVVSPLFRRRRMRRFMARFKPDAGTRILDVGGWPGTWHDIGCEARISVMNVHPIEYAPVDGGPSIDLSVGDGRELDYGDGAFDIVFSNSVVEHVGDLDDQRAFAREAARCGRALWIQTPARWFPIEPHLLAPFVHYLPRRIQRRLVRYFTGWGLITKPDPEQIEAFLDGTRLLTLADMRALFPDCEIQRERFLGLTKSYVAVRDAPSGPA